MPGIVCRIMFSKSHYEESDSRARRVLLLSLELLLLGSMVILLIQLLHIDLLPLEGIELLSELSILRLEVEVALESNALLVDFIVREARGGMVS